MRVVHVTRDFPPRCCGGISTGVGGLVRALARTGAVQTPVPVVSFDAWRPSRGTSGTSPVPERVGDAVVLRVRGEADLAAARAFVGRADVLHVHDGMLHDFATGCAAGLRVFTPHVIHRALNAVRGVTERTRSLQAQERALAEADVVVAPSEAAARMLDVEVVVARLGIDLPVEVVRATGPPTVLHVGRFDVAKGTGDLIEIATAVLRGSPDVVVEIAGGIPENAKAEGRRRRRIDAELSPGVRDRVRLLGWLGGEGLDAAYGRATVLLQPSRLETVGLSVLEAMARGVPVVATRCGGPEEIVTPDVGRLVEVGDVAGAASAVLDVLADPHARGERAGAAARGWSWPEVVGEWLEAYRVQP